MVSQTNKPEEKSSGGLFLAGCIFIAVAVFMGQAPAAPATAPAAAKPATKPAATTTEPKAAEKPVEVVPPGVTYLDVVRGGRLPPKSSDLKMVKERVQRVLSGNTNDAKALAERATMLLESGYGTRPPTPEDMKQGKADADKATELAPKAAASLRAQMALLLANGDAEDAIGLASKYAEADDTAEANTILGHAYLAATCAKACAARKQEQVGVHAPKGTVYQERNDPSSKASTHRAASMWRVMEGGRTFSKAAGLAPGNRALEEVSEATKNFRDLNAYQVSSSDTLMELGDCEVYVGLKLDGKRCPAVGDNPFKKDKKKKTKKA